MMFTLHVSSVRVNGPWARETQVKRNDFGRRATVEPTIDINYVDCPSVRRRAIGIVYERAPISRRSLWGGNSFGDHRDWPVLSWYVRIPLDGPDQTLSLVGSGRVVPKFHRTDPTRPDPRTAWVSDKSAGLSLVVDLSAQSRHARS